MNTQMRPDFISLPIIAQCNYRCGFCEINGVDEKLHKIGKSYQRNIMTVENVLAFTSMLRSARVVNIGGRTGLGEPLYAPTFDDIIRTIRDINKNIVIDLSTNGLLLTKERSDFLIAHAPVSLTFSLHAATPEVYARVMGPGNKNRFERVIENIRYFCSARKGVPTRTNINFGIGRLNQVDAVAAVRMAKSLGVDMMTVYLYYKSPNDFDEDVSLYDDVKLTNDTLRAVYDEAARVRLQLDPKEPKFIVEQKHQQQSIIPALDVVSGKTAFPTDEKPYAGGCHEPFSSFLFKSDPFRKGQSELAVCNRISPMIADIDKMTNDDLFWAWHHPVFNSMRLPNPLSVPPICRVCKDPGNAALRSLDHEAYKARRDAAVRETLKPFQTEELMSSPTGAIRLLSDNIFSIDADVCE